MKKGVLCFDMDLTLFSHKTWSIPDSAIKAIHKAKKNYYIVIATGRDLDNKESVSQLANIQPDGLVYSNGCKVTLGNNILRDQSLDKSSVKGVLEYCIEHNLLIGTVLNDKPYYTSQELVDDLIENLPNDKDKEAARMWFYHIYPLEDLFDLDVKTLLYLGDLSYIEEMKQKFSAFTFARNTSKGSPYKSVGLWPAHITKREGIQLLLDKWKMSFDDVIAFGDSMNDYEMIRDAKVGIVMGNGSSELIKIADYVTGSVEEDGIYHAMKELRIIEE